jgi:hypothetical protein
MLVLTLLCFENVVAIVHVACDSQAIGRHGGVVSQ